jgi:hypothetical protein
MSSVIKNIYNKKTKGHTLTELFTATGILKKGFFTTRDVRCVPCHPWCTHRTSPVKYRSDNWILVLPSVCPYASGRLPVEGFVVKICYRLSLKSVEKFRRRLQSEKISRILHKLMNVMLLPMTLNWHKTLSSSETVSGC